MLKRLIAPQFFNYFSKNNSHNDLSVYFNHATAWKKTLPGLVFGHMKNQEPWLIPVKHNAKRIRLQLSANHAEVLNFNHLKIWKHGTDGTRSPITADYTCHSSSTAPSLTDPSACMKGDAHNTVTIHSKREIKPFWEITLDHETYIDFIEFYNRKDQWGKRARSLVVEIYDTNGKLIDTIGRSRNDKATSLWHNEVKPTIDSITQILSPDDVNYFTKKVTELFAHHSNAPKKQKVKQEINDFLYSTVQSIEIKPQELELQKETATPLQIPATTKKIRILTFGSHKPQLSVTVQENDTELSLKKQPPLSAHIYTEIRERLIKEYPHLGSFQADEYDIENPSISENLNLLIWANNIPSISASLVRYIEYTTDGENWSVVESTIPSYHNLCAILFFMEWLNGEAAPLEFFYIASFISAKYRMKVGNKSLKAYKTSLEKTRMIFSGAEKGGAATKQLPKVIMTRHGLNVPLSERDHKHLAETMKRFCDYMLKTHDLKVFPCYGTLLGIHRDNTFMAHDDDVDVATVIDKTPGACPVETRDYWINQFKKAGMNCKSATANSYNLHCFFEGLTMDLFLMMRENSSITCHMEKYKVREFDTSLIIPEKHLEFMGKQFYAPNNIEGFLLERYGPGWTKPDPYFEV